MPLGHAPLYRITLACSSRTDRPRQGCLKVNLGYRGRSCYCKPDFIRRALAGTSTFGSSGALAAQLLQLGFGLCEQPGFGVQNHAALYKSLAFASIAGAEFCDAEVEGGNSLVVQRGAAI